MFKKCSLLVKTFLWSLVVTSSACVLNPAVGAYDRNDNRNSIFISDSRELQMSIKNAQEDDEIVLENDISLEGKINIESSIRLNLNGHTILINSDEDRITIGKKTFSHTEQYFMNHPGYYSWEDKLKIVKHSDRYSYDESGRVVTIHVPDTQEVVREMVWHDPRVETCSKNVFDYNDDIDVVIQNGTIKRAPGENGLDGRCDSPCYYCGGNGKTPGAPVHIISGTVRLKNATLRGGDGGNGGNGGYQSLTHLPISFDGNGGDGGNGGDAGRPYELERSECRIYKDDFSNCYYGNAGLGGKGGKANPGWWIYSGSDGKAGKAGKKQ